MRNALPVLTSSKFLYRQKQHSLLYCVSCFLFFLSFGQLGRFGKKFTSSSSSRQFELLAGDSTAIRAATK